MPRSDDRPSLLRSDRLFARALARFLRVEASSAIVLLAATVAALVWANSPWSDAYTDLWATDVPVVGDLRHLVDDGLMALFFFVVGLEIKHELVEGGLSSARLAALPVVGAVGGMVVPALVYAAWNAGGAGSSGWGIPMATDIAFAVGVLSLVARPAPPGRGRRRRSLARRDDNGAIVVIAVFYADDLSTGWLLAAVGAAAVAAVVGRVGGRAVAPAFVVVGAAAWYAAHESGVHATIAGVAIGLLYPVRGRPRAIDVQGALHPWTSYAVLPLFALANAGVELSTEALRDAAGSPVTIGVGVGLVVGKLVGVAGAIGLAVRLGIGRLPDGVDGRSVVGVAALAGIGFTVSLFVTGLAFDDAGLRREATLGVLAASVVAAAIGSVVLRRSPTLGDP